MARGDQGRPIFQDDKDRRRFRETRSEACAKTGWRIHACVLLGNHYTRVSQAVGRVKRRPGRKLEPLKRKVIRQE